MRKELKQALQDPIWLHHKLNDLYVMDNRPERWKLAYYPLLEDGKTGEEYDEPRALVEKPIIDKLGIIVGTDFREIPLRYLKKVKHDGNKKN